MRKCAFEGHICTAHVDQDISRKNYDYSNYNTNKLFD